MSETTAGDEWLTALQVRNLTRDALESRGARFIGAGMEMAGQSPVADLSVDYGGRRYTVVITDTGKAGPWL